MNGAKILIVEDESLIAAELKDRLERMSFDVVAVVATSEDALALSVERSPDLVLMDIRLRGSRDGVEAAAAIRERADIPVVFLTAHSDEITIQRAIRTAPFGYLIKPFVESELRVTIDLALHKHGLERRLKESEERFRATLMSIGDAVIATDADARITFMNPVAEAMTRWTRTDAIGRQLDEVVKIVDPETHAVVHSPVSEALRDAKVVSLWKNAHLVASDGTEVPIDDTAAPILDGRECVCGAVLALRDVSERRRVEHTLRETEDRLRHAQKMEAVGRLAGGVAHEFNNQMTVVIANGELAERKLPKHSPVRTLVTEMKDAGNRAATITRQLLAFSRKQLLRAVPVNLNEVVGRLELMLGRVIGEHIQITTRLDPTLGTVRVDPGQMEQVIMNLAINARDSMPGGGRLLLETRNASYDELDAREGLDAERGDYVALTVTDTGMGMTPETKAQIFEPFFTTKETGKGSGLGLATVYGIVKQSGGYVYVDSEPGRGATFEVFLPRVSDEPPPVIPRAKIEVARGTETVLVVEDEPSVRKLTSTILLSCGYKVLEAANGLEAIERYERSGHHIHLLLTDTVMPHMSGFHLAERISESHPGLKVLFMSGYMKDHLPSDVLTDATFISKPFSGPALTRKIREVLDAP